MKKNKLFIISSVLIMICLFTTAVTCNLCGNPVKIAVSEQDTSGMKPEPTGETEGTTRPEPQSPAEPVEDNNPPVIEEIELMGRDIEFMAAEGAFDEIPVGAVSGPILTIEASDPDDDAIQYTAYDSRGTSFEVTKIDNNNAEFLWELPSEAGPYTLTVEVSDGRGGADSYSIDMNFVLAVVDFIPPENNPPEIRGDIIVENLPGIDSPEGGPYIGGGIHYRVSVEADDPDGDPLNYRWSGGGSEGYTDATANPTEWITPVIGNYSIFVTVSDGRGGEARTSVSVRVE